MYPAGLPMQIMRKHDAEKNGIRGILSRNVQKSTDIEKGKLTVSRRYNLLPLLPSGPDGVQRELSVRDLPFGCVTTLTDTHDSKCSAIHTLSIKQLIGCCFRCTRIQMTPAGSTSTVNLYPSESDPKALFAS